MSTRSFVFAVFILAFFAARAQQIPNGGLENWTNPVHPDGWTDIEDAYGVAQSYFTFKDTLDYVEGRASVRIVTDTVVGNPAAGIQSGFLGLGTVFNSETEGLTFNGIPFSYKPDSFFFSYKYTSPGLDTALVFMEFRRTRGHIGEDVLEITYDLLPDGVWHNIVQPLDSSYLVNTVDTIRIVFWSSRTEGDGHIPILGSVLHIDGVRFGYNPVCSSCSGIQPVAASFGLKVFPNPASSSIYINGPAVDGQTDFELFDATGRLAKQEKLDQALSAIDISGLTNGFYFYRVSNADLGSISGKIVIDK